MLDELAFFLFTLERLTQADGRLLGRMMGGGVLGMLTVLVRWRNNRKGKVKFYPSKCLLCSPSKIQNAQSGWILL